MDIRVGKNPESFSQYPVPDGEVSAPEATGTLSPSDRLNSENIGQSVEATERTIPAEDALRLVIDTTPALIHTGRPDGYLDYFNRSWREYTGKSLAELCAVASD
jgi:PAS domain-containing protein